MCLSLYIAPVICNTNRWITSVYSFAATRLTLSLIHEVRGDRDEAMKPVASPHSPPCSPMIFAQTETDSIRSQSVLKKQRNRTTATSLAIHYTVETDTKVDDTPNTSRASTSLGGSFAPEPKQRNRATGTSFPSEPIAIYCTVETDTKVDDTPSTSRASTSLGDLSSFEHTGTPSDSCEGFSSVNRDETLEEHVVLSNNLASNTPSN
jgi:hypothetical protein